MTMEENEESRILSKRRLWAARKWNTVLFVIPHTNTSTCSEETLQAPVDCVTHPHKGHVEVKQ